MKKQNVYFSILVAVLIGLSGCGKKGSSEPETSKKPPKQEKLAKSKKRRKRAQEKAAPQPTEPAVEEAPPEPAKPKMEEPSPAEPSIDFDVEPDEDDVAEGEIEFDRIEAVVEGAEQTDVISTSDIHRRVFDGMQHSLDDIIDERLRNQEAIKMKIEATDEAIDRYLQMMSQGQPMSKEYLSEVANAHGYTLDGFYEELKRLYRSNNLVNFEVNANMELTDEEVKKYYDAHPIYTEAEYYVQTAFAPRDEAVSVAEQRKRLETATSQERGALNWSSPLKLMDDDITDENEFLSDLPVNGIHIVADDDQFILYRMQDRKDVAPVPLEERLGEIRNILGKEKYDRLFKQLNQGLRDNAEIYYMNED